METGQIIKATHTEEGFKVLTTFGAWRVGMVRYSERFSKFAELEKHLETDEVHILMSGKGTLYTDREQVEMEIGAVYTVPAGVWHHIVVSEDANVIIVENSNTVRENTEKNYFEQKEK